MPWVHHITLFRKHARKILAGALIFWLLVGSLVYCTELVAHHYFGAKGLDLVEQRQYLLRWLLWLLLTPAIIVLALRVNIGNCRLGWFVVLHILFGTALLGLEFLGEVAVIKPLAERFYQRPVAIDEIVVPFLLKYFGYIINYFLIVGIVNMYVYMQSLQATQKHLLQTELHNKELQYQLTLTQLQALRMQIQPHFLFNAHQAIIGLIVTKENDKAAQMLTTLSELLRATLDQQDREFVPLSEELQTADLYLAIQQIRFGERFTYTRDISVEAATISIPYFMLQPIVENAVIHGVEQTDEAAVIHIAASVADDRLVLSICNTGRLSARQDPKGMGIGIGNVTARLKQYYGDRASFSLSSATAGPPLTIATIIIPVNV